MFDIPRFTGIGDSLGNKMEDNKGRKQKLSVVFIKEGRETVLLNFPQSDYSFVWRGISLPE